MGKYKIKSIKNKHILITMEQKLILVTGANQGIGYAIVQGIMKKKLPYNIIICCRSQEKGQEAINQLLKEFPDFKGNLDVGILDLADSESIKSFKNWFVQKYKSGYDILFNNAGMAFRGDRFDKEVCDITFATNFDGTVNFTHTMEEFCKPNGKILFMSSQVSHMAIKKLSNENKQPFLK